MQVRELILPIERPSAGFIQRLGFHFMDKALKRGWNAERDGQMFGGISEPQARRVVAYAQRNGFLLAPMNMQDSIERVGIQQLTLSKRKSRISKRGSP
jgi:hypothetical protein